MTPADLIQEWLDTLPDWHAERAGGVRAIEVLRAHEREHGVVFTPLHTSLRAKVKAAWDRLGEIAEEADADDPPSIQDDDARRDAAARADFISATADMLDLKEGRTL